MISALSRLTSDQDNFAISFKRFVVRISSLITAPWGPPILSDACHTARSSSGLSQRSRGGVSPMTVFGLRSAKGLYPSVPYSGLPAAQLYKRLPMRNTFKAWYFLPAATIGLMTARTSVGVTSLTG